MAFISFIIVLDKSEKDLSCSSTAISSVATINPENTANTSSEQNSAESPLVESKCLEVLQNISSVISPISNDPSEWLNVDSKTLLEHFIKCSFDQNILKSQDFSKSKRKYNDQIRYLSRAVFTRTSLNGEKVPREWLIYSQNTGNIFCGPCRIFNNEDSKFGSKDGFNDWKHVYSSVKSHENSNSHKSCILNMKFHAKNVETIDHQLFSQIHEEKTYWKNVLKRVVVIIKTLAIRGHSFRGSDATLFSPYNGNFLMCIEMIAEFDPFLAQHIAKYGNKGKGHVHYFSKTIYEEFITLMADKVTKFILDECRKAKYFSIILDSTPDISHIDQLSFIIRYVKENGSPIERFLKFIPNIGHKAADIVKAVEETLELLQIRMEDCRGQSYDNAANMAGIYNGVQAKIQTLCKQAEYAPCAAHSLNLVGASAAECCLEGSTFFTLLQELYNFFTASTARWNVLQSRCNNSASKYTVLKSLSQTRWSAREDACESLRNSFREIYESLLFF